MKWIELFFDKILPALLAFLLLIVGIYCFFTDCLLLGVVLVGWSIILELIVFVFRDES